MLAVMPDTGYTRCSECGTENEGGAVYCKNCGQKLAPKPRTCDSCGAPVPQYAVAMCPACGAILKPINPQQGPGSTEQLVQAGGTQRYEVMDKHMLSPQQPTPETAQREAKVFGKLRLFGILGMAGAVLGILVLLSGNFLILLAAGRGAAQAAGGVLIFDAVILIAELATGVYSIVVIRSAFRLLSAVDPRFHTPASLVTIFIAGLIFVFPPILLIITLGSATAPASLTAGVLLAVGLLIIVGAVLVILGAIGLLLGLWRVGTRYNDSLFKIAAICYLIPFLSIVSSILIYVSSTSFLRRWSGGPGQSRI